MPETGRDLSDERSTPTECSVASLVELNGAAPDHWSLASSGRSVRLRVLESSGMHSREPAMAAAPSAIVRQTGGSAGRLPRSISLNCVLRTQQYRDCSQSHAKRRQELTRSRISAERRPPQIGEPASASCDCCC